MSDTVMRWVVTHKNGLGWQALTFPRQGRYTYPTQEEAEAALRAFEPDLRSRVLGDRADTLEVRQVECWPNHHDPKGIYAD